MINFGDLSPIAGANITEPVSKGKSIAMQAFKEGVMSIEKGIQEESAAMKAVADELYKSGKVDFMGKDVKEFAGFYKNKKKELVEALKPFSSVQAFLNNGGYDKIAEFKNEIENSDAYRAGVQNKLQYETIRALQAKGLSKFKFEDGKGLQNWLNGNSDIGFMGTYNHDQIDPTKWVINKEAEYDEGYSEQELRSLLKTSNYSPEDIETAVAAQKSNGNLFLKSMKDPNWGLKKAQLANTVENTQSLKQARLDKAAYDKAMIDLKNTQAKMENYVIEAGYNDWISQKQKFPIQEFDDAPKFFDTKTVNTTTKEVLTGAQAENAITSKTAEKVDYLKTDDYILLEPNAEGIKSTAKTTKVQGAIKDGEPYWDAKYDAWVIPIVTKTGDKYNAVKKTNSRNNPLSKRTIMLQFKNEPGFWKMQEGPENVNVQGEQRVAANFNR